MDILYFIFFIIFFVFFIAYFIDEINGYTNIRNNLFSFIVSLVLPIFPLVMFIYVIGGEPHYQLIYEDTQKKELISTIREKNTVTTIEKILPLCKIILKIKIKNVILVEPFDKKTTFNKSCNEVTEKNLKERFNEYKS